MSAAAALLAALSAIAWAGPARGPWLVDATSTSARVCWRAPRAAMHCKDLRGLRPGAPFRYRVPISTMTFTAKALPGAGAPLRFAVFGDMGSGKPAQYRVSALLNRLDPDLVVVTGDVVYERGADRDYDRKFFRPYAAILPRRPFFPALGNHDYGDYDDAARGERAYEAGYRAVFERPKYYSFDAGPAHFVVLDTNAAYRTRAAAPVGPDSEQVRWLEADLAGNRRKWVFAVMHVPLYSTLWIHGDNSALREALAPLFEKYHVAAVFAGHDHIYQRTKSRNGVVYIIAGTGGGTLNWGLTKPAWLEDEDESYGLVLGDLRGGKLRLRFLDETGAARDELTLTRP